MILGLCMDMAQENYSIFRTDIPTIACMFSILRVTHFILLLWVEKVKVYNGIFVNDADGVLQSKVIARALGITEEKVVFDVILVVTNQIQTKEYD